MEETKNPWKGLGAIAVVRQSDDGEGTSSTAAQLDFMKKTFERVGMKFVDKVELDGVRASAPAKITQIVQTLFERKKSKNDFEVIAWQVEDRASRGGGDHGMWLEHEAKRHGILIFYPGDEGPKIPYHSLIRHVKYEAAKEGSVSTGRRSAQGQSHAIKTGFFRTAGKTPLGCDRLYLSSDDQPKFVIHNLLDGRQEQRDFKTGQVIGMFGTAERKSRNRFRKQRNEYSLLIFGDRDGRRTVRVIFYLRYKRGWRGAKIADYLNRNGVPSPKGKSWSQRQVQIIYENEAYTGVTYNDRTFSGRYFRRDKEMGFVALDREECELVMKKTFSPTVRQMDEWERIDQPNMYDFLPKDVRDLAITAMSKIWAARTDPSRPKRKPSAHPASDFLFSGRLQAVQDDGFLVGTISGTSDHPIPYYRHRKSKRGRRKGSVFNRLIPATPLHEAAVAVLADVLLDTPELRSKLTAYVEEHRAALLQDEPDIVELERERDEIRLQIKAVLSSLKGAALEDAQEELTRLGARRNQIEVRLKAVTNKSKEDALPVATVVDDAIRVLESDRRRLLQMPVAVTRDLVNRLITELTVDMETKNIELMVTLPTWALHTAEQPPSKTCISPAETAIAAEEPVCPPQTLQSPMDGWTQPVLASFHCSHVRVSASAVAAACYKCRRLAA